MVIRRLLILSAVAEGVAMSPHRIFLLTVLGLSGAALAYNAFLIIDAESGPSWADAPITCCRGQPTSPGG